MFDLLWFLGAALMALLLGGLCAVCNTDEWERLSTCRRAAVYAPCVALLIGMLYTIGCIGVPAAMYLAMAFCLLCFITSFMIISDAL